MVKKIRIILCGELIAYFFAAPYIILLALDEKRGFFDASVSTTYRFWGYAFLVALYPLLQSILSPYVGAKLDREPAKAQTLRRIHLANCSCYLLLACAAYFKMLLPALLGLAIPGIVGSAAPVGKSLIATLTRPEDRVKEFATIAYLKGIVKFVAPLVGAFLFHYLFPEDSYAPLFCVSALFSISCFFFTFSLKGIQGAPVTQNAAKANFSLIFRKNSALFFVFLLLLTGYCLFVKFTPVIFYDRLSETPYLVNYFSSLVGLSFACNQFLLSRFSKYIEQHRAIIFTYLIAATVLFCCTSLGIFWFLSLFGILFSFSALATCVEAEISLEGIVRGPGTVQGVLYSVENWSYLLAPLLGTFLVSFDSSYPLYFVAFAACSAATLFIIIQRKATKIKQDRPQPTG